MRRTGPIVILGGTGMLLPLATRLARSGEVVVVGRQERPQGRGPRLLAADWHDATGYRSLLQRLAQPRPRVVVAWVHSDAAITHEEAVARLRPALYVRVLGSSDRSRLDRMLATSIDAPDGVLIRSVVLGMGPGGRRWLTHEEISEGVGSAIASDSRIVVVGELP